MRPVWTGKVIGKMHIYSISQAELAEEIGCSREYVNGVLNGKHKFADSREKIETALAIIIERRKA